MNETGKLVAGFARIVLRAQAEQTASCEVAVELALACKEAGLKFVETVSESEETLNVYHIEEIELEE